MCVGHTVIWKVIHPRVKTDDLSWSAAAFTICDGDSLLRLTDVSVHVVREAKRPVLGRVMTDSANSAAVVSASLAC